MFDSNFTIIVCNLCQKSIGRSNCCVVKNHFRSVPQSLDVAQDVNNSCVLKLLENEIKNSRRRCSWIELDY